MDTQDLFVITAFALITTFFFIIGHKEKIFSLIFSVIIIIYLFSIFNFSSFPRLNEVFLVISGLILYFLGLLNIAQIAKRSVSLHIIKYPLNAHSLKKLQGELSARIADITDHRLGIMSHSKINLTPFGKFIANLTSLMYKILKIKND
jgi:hypothetical protein